MPPVRILFVDDEPNLRLTLPIVLEQHGYMVAAGASVPEALQLIHRECFDVLIADLNIGEPGDGFTVVSAMRRTQPDCVNIILTGYPAFETALEAIRKQVDDFLVKPADVQTLVAAIEDKLNHRRPRRQPRAIEVSELLRQKIDEIIRRTLKRMKSHPEIGAFSLGDEERVDHLPNVVRKLAELLASGHPERVSPAALREAAAHGRTRYRQGYPLTLLVEDTRLLSQAICAVVQESMLELDLSRVIPDLAHASDSLQLQLGASLRAYQEAERKAA